MRNLNAFLMLIIWGLFASNFVIGKSENDEKGTSGAKGIISSFGSLKASVSDLPNSFSESSSKYSKIHSTSDSKDANSFSRSSRTREKHHQNDETIKRFEKRSDGGNYVNSNTNNNSNDGNDDSSSALAILAIVFSMCFGILFVLLLLLTKKKTPSRLSRNHMAATVLREDEKTSLRAPIVAIPSLLDF